jgi:outer membrane protein TolC
MDTSVPSAAARRRRHRLRVPLSAALLCATAAGALAADPMSDTFQPDAFRTREALRHRTPGLDDPFAHDCSQPAEPLTLVAAVYIALCRNPATRGVWAAAHQAAAAYGSAESAWLPTLTATDAETRTEGTHTDATGATVSSTQNSNDAAVNLTWVLYDFGGRGGRIASARYLLDAAAETADRSVQQTVFSAVQGFFGVTSADAALLAAKSAEDAAARSVEITKALHEGGASALSDVLQAETAYDQAVLARVQAGQSAKSAIALLAITMGLPADQPLKLRAESVPADVPALTARLSDLMTEAMRQRPDLKAALAQRDSAVADVTVARAEGRPSITVSAARTHIETTGLPVQNYGQIGISVSVPIFSGFKATYDIRQAQAILEAREANADQIRLNVSQDVWNGYWGLESAGQELTASGTLVKTAAQNQEVAVGRYQAGIGTILDLLTAQTAAASAQQTRITAEHDWQVARAQLVLALGRLTGTEPLRTGVP